MNDKFYLLEEEKQLKIINAAMEVFGKNEYKKASTDLIAAKAGISKGLLFYYFHNKKELYMFIYNYLIEIMKEQVADKKFLELTDFFELLEYAATGKVWILDKNPYIMDFTMRAFYSEKECVSDDLKSVNTKQEEIMYQTYFGHIETYKFKDGIDPFKVFKMLRWMGDGYIHDIQMSGRGFNINELLKEFNEWMDMMKRLVYKEEYQI
ncbi:TetR/AcrR family transcriptional regulator [Faecalicatena orotica]|uniref:TetR family transcriptional regulator n=2 Tax=Bacillota TaxID=1239 RepID=A0A2Y9BMN8_9FIRM|nr:TetR/AcrR family transcriptional regulator [Faecalicatena orotica]PWJ23472.1 TetR family transcriptional regulator [Faecalicatena orotica]SSA57734.1 transcriptional regulator, TetR family [Faecalicatena orotica]